MGLKTYEPTSPGRRFMSGATFEELTGVAPEKSLLVPLKKKAGRNSRGVITVRHRGGGSKRKLRLIDFRRDKIAVPGKVASIEYDPNRAARIALIHYADGEKRYILAPLDIKLGDTVQAGEDVDIKSPLLRGGGIVFGPKPRSYRQSMPKKMRRLALKSLLSAKVREGNIKLVQELDFKEPKTKDMMNVLSSLGIDSSALILTAQSTPNVVKSAANLPEVKVLPSALINVLDLLSYKILVATVPAIRNIEQIWGK